MGVRGVLGHPQRVPTRHRETPRNFPCGSPPGLPVAALHAPQPAVNATPERSNGTDVHPDKSCSHTHTRRYTDRCENRTTDGRRGGPVVMTSELINDTSAAEIYSTNK